ncbi:MAG: MerR family DNA-binding transcriptional regulator [Chloroflexi bacterium]|jgi:DNA-binding transcriptional MerR regulator|nr:MerR family DNA-binding transcriptional regulator [Chloroflexota bacterium]
MPRRFLYTTDLAKAVGAHPNTVRLYEAWGFLPPVPRTPSGYRQFSETHLEHMRLAWTALHNTWICKPLLLDTVRTAAAGDLGGALERAYNYLAQVRSERVQAEAAIAFLEAWAQGKALDRGGSPSRIGETARRLHVSPDMLRNWERNGLLKVPRDPHSGYRLYGPAEAGRVRVIRMLRQAGYSVMAILRMMIQFDQGQRHNLGAMLDTPRPDEDVYYAADRWLSALAEAEQIGLDVIDQLEALLAKSHF